LSLYILEPKEEDTLTYPLAFSQDHSELNGLFIAGEINSDYLKSLSDLPIPVVAIDFYKNNLRLDYIVSDNYRMGYFTTNYLVEQGHKAIGFVGNPNYTSSVMDRYCGYFRALTEHGLEHRQDWNIVNNDESGKYHLDFSLPEQLPTAFVCYCDMAAHILLSKLQISGVRVPEDVSLISFDNTDLSQTMVPALTTMHIDKFEFAEKALKRMQWRLQHPDEEAQFVYVNSTLIERDSVKSLMVPSLI
jgi:LacI family transcriptional regulator